MRGVAMVAGVLAAAGMVCAAGPAATGGTAATRSADGPGFVLEIGHDTTRVMGPIAPDGTIDYGHALWQVMHAGVTAENNGYAVLAGMAVKVKPVPEKLEEEGVESGQDPFDQAVHHPWKAGEYPEMAAWLKENEFVLDAARGLVDTDKGRKLTRWCPPEPAMGAAFNGWPWKSQLMQVGEALQARAMERVGEGDEAGARSDAELLARLGELVGSEPVFLAMTYQQSLEREACRVAVAGARKGTAAEQGRWLALVQRTAALRMDPEVPDFQVRFEGLGQVMTIVRGDVVGGLKDLTLLDLASMFVPGAERAQVSVGDLEQVDWNEVMRKINAQMDEEVRIAREPGVKGYRDAKAMADRVNRADVPGNVFDAVLGPALESGEKGAVGKQQKSLEEQVNAFVKRRAGESVVAFSDRIATWVTRTEGEAFDVLPEHALDAEAERRASAVAIALEIYKGEHGSYPEALAALVPGILKEIPADPWAADGAALRYAQEKGEYVVYSVGSTGEDVPRGAKGMRPDAAVSSEKGRDVVSVGEAATRP